MSSIYLNSVSRQFVRCVFGKICLWSHSSRKSAFLRARILPQFIWWALLRLRREKPSLHGTVSLPPPRSLHLSHHINLNKKKRRWWDWTLGYQSADWLLFVGNERRPQTRLSSQYGNWGSSCIFSCSILCVERLPSYWLWYIYFLIFAKKNNIEIPSFIGSTITEWTAQGPKRDIELPSGSKLFSLIQWNDKLFVTTETGFILFIYWASTLKKRNNLDCRWNQLCRVAWNGWGRDGTQSSTTKPKGCGVGWCLSLPSQSWPLRLLQPKYGWGANWIR